MEHQDLGASSNNLQVKGNAYLADNSQIKFNAPCKFAKLSWNLKSDVESLTVDLDTASLKSDQSLSEGAKKEILSSIEKYLQKYLKMLKDRGTGRNNMPMRRLTAVPTETVLPFSLVYFTSLLS